MITQFSQQNIKIISSNNMIRIICYFSLLLMVILSSISCKTNRMVSVAKSTAEISIQAFNAESKPSEQLTDHYSLNVKTVGEDKLVSVLIKDADDWKYSFIELTFPSNYTTTDFIKGDKCKSALVYSAQYSTGKAIVAAVIPNNNPDNITGNGELVRFRLTPGTFKNTSSITSQNGSDPVIQNQTLDSGVLTWTEVLRGDTNSNQIIDFADFGVIGAHYNQKPTSTNEPWDPSNNGLVDFEDFGVVGAGYGQKVAGYSIYSGSKLEKKYSKDGSFAPELKGSTGSRGWPLFQVVVDWAEVDPITVKIISDSNTAYSISKISASQDNFYTNAVVELSLSTLGTTPDLSTAYWMTDGGSFVANPPDAWHLVRATAATTDTYTGAKAYLKFPSNATSVKVTVLLGEALKSASFTVVNSVVTLTSSSDGFGNTLITAKANEVTNLYQIAFRVYYDTSRFKMTGIKQGSFLGSSSNTLFLGHEFKSGQIACSITKRGEVAGVNGSGTLATITLTPIKSGSSSVEEEPVSIELDSARTSDGREIAVK